mmetsp:Transcript_28018/g.46153  ORF Transcript_28018/g.46153 Transcript_28018/m.46153 type:complete len:312 (+) Transcript_28018:88-1023(+)
MNTFLIFYVVTVMTVITIIPAIATAQVFNDGFNLYIVPVIAAVVKTATPVVKAAATSAAPKVAAAVTSAGPAGWLIVGGVFVAASAIGFVAWLFGGSDSSKNTNEIDDDDEKDMRYVNADKQEKRAPVYSVALQQQQKMKENALKITAFHVSCQSDHPLKDQIATGQWNAIGIILFEYGGQTDFYINKRHCKPGYIVLKSPGNLTRENGETYHAACFRSVFGQSHKTLSKTLIGGGFSVQNGKCAFNSRTFNCGAGKNDPYHFGTHTMNPMIQHYIEIAVKNWIQHRQQNTRVADVTDAKLKNTLCVHPNA